MNRLEKLEKLLADSTPGPWSFDPRHRMFIANETRFGRMEDHKEAELICALRNSASAIIEILKIAKRLVPHPDTIQWTRIELELKAAFEKFEESEL